MQGHHVTKIAQQIKRDGDNVVTKITSGKSLNSLLTSLIEESLKSALQQRSIREKDQQDNFVPQATEPEVEPAPTQSKTVETDKETLSGGAVTVDDVINKLNTIRSGKSFKDESIKGSMTQYVDSLSKAEKTALLAFLKGIAQLVTGEIPANNATEPSDNPADVSMKKKGDQNSQTTKHIEPNVIKTKMSKPSEKKVEDDVGPTPVKVKSKQ